MDTNYEELKRERVELLKRIADGLETIETLLAREKDSRRAEILFNHLAEAKCN